MKDIFDQYRTKAGLENEELKFFFNGIHLNDNVVISRSGLFNQAIINVYKKNEFHQINRNVSYPQSNDPINIIFAVNNGPKINVLISPNDKLQDAIDQFKSKTNNPNETYKFVFNSISIDPSKTPRELLLYPGSAIETIPLSSLKGGKN